MTQQPERQDPPSSSRGGEDRSRIEHALSRAAELMRFSRELSEVLQAEFDAQIASLELRTPVPHTEDLADFCRIASELCSVLDSLPTELTPLRVPLVVVNEVSIAFWDVLNREIEIDLCGYRGVIQSISQRLWKALELIRKTRELKNPFAQRRDALMELDRSRQAAVESWNTLPVESAEFDGDLTSPDDADSDTTPNDRLVVASWSKLGIGIDEEMRYFAFIPVPEEGAKVRKQDATVLPLPGERWECVLEALSMSPDGRELTVDEFLMAFGPTRRQNTPTRDRRTTDGESTQAYKVESGNIKDPDREWVESTVTDLSRKLRQYVDGPKGPGKSALSLDGDYVRAGFTVRALVPDASRSLHFGQPYPR